MILVLKLLFKINCNIALHEFLLIEKNILFAEIYPTITELCITECEVILYTKLPL